ncbi:MAG: SIS domain-containing protein [Actinomycetota bacterium]|nr:SIS domain-containing protein [Actinomycetota bacterium]
MSPSPLLHGQSHLGALVDALAHVLTDLPVLDRWGRELADILGKGGRLLAVGNGGSAAQAQHLTAELVGRYRDDRRPFSAISLHADTSSLTAIANDYGVEAAFARQVVAHGREGDALVALSTSGHSRNVVAAVRVAQQLGLRTWGMTGKGPNPVAELCDEAVAIETPSTATTQEVHLVLIHLLCASLDLALDVSSPAKRTQPNIPWGWEESPPSGNGRPT